MLKKLWTLIIVLILTTACTSQATTNQPLIVGMECNYAPFNWMQDQADDTAIAVAGTNGYCNGYDVMIARHLASTLNRELEIKVLSWEGLIPSLNSGSIDAIIAGMSYTSERAEVVNFTQPYYSSDYVMLVQKDSPLANATSLNDFIGKKIVGQMGTNYDIIIDQIEKVDHQPALATYPLIVNALLSGSADGAPAEKPTAQAIVKANPQLQIVEFAHGHGFTQSAEVTTEVSIAVRKEDSQLLSDINSVLSQLTQEQRDQWMSQAIELNQE